MATDVVLMKAMIIECPTCSCKYSVKAEAIGSGKMVRCTACGMTWQQTAADVSLERKQRVWRLVHWTFFWFLLLVPAFALLFEHSTVSRIWPAAGDFYEAIGIPVSPGSKSLLVRNVSNFFERREGKLYMGLKGEVLNTSDAVLPLPGMTISLLDDMETAPQKNPVERYKKIWTHNLTNKKLLPGQKIAFETEPQSVPNNNLICEIKLDTL
ncbi:MAG: zinc-ribbon domain-containing protein [Holosporaceae bacterium]|jgi:predicted Zn finger-like uncharacterized protein|nr:zinc-ribbon domain-containing protein [Holosporaceae bacterium]